MSTLHHTLIVRKSRRVTFEFSVEVSHFNTHSRSFRLVSGPSCAMPLRTTAYQYMHLGHHWIFPAMSVVHEAIPWTSVVQLCSLESYGSALA